MNFLLQPLSLLTFFPLVGVLVLLFLPAEQKNWARWTALVTSLITFGISLLVLSAFDQSNPDLQLTSPVQLDSSGGLEHPILSGGGRPEHPARSFDGFPDPHLDPFNLDGCRRRASRIS